MKRGKFTAALMIALVIAVFLFCEIGSSDIIIIVFPIINNITPSNEKTPSHPHCSRKKPGIVPPIIAPTYPIPSMIPAAVDVPFSLAALRAHHVF